MSPSTPRNLRRSVTSNTTLHHLLRKEQRYMGKANRWARHARRLAAKIATLEAGNLPDAFVYFEDRLVAYENRRDAFEAKLRDVRIDLLDELGHSADLVPEEQLTDASAPLYPSGTFAVDAAAQI